RRGRRDGGGEMELGNGGRGGGGYGGGGIAWGIVQARKVRSREGAGKLEEEEDLVREGDGFFDTDGRTVVTEIVGGGEGEEGMVGLPPKIRKVEKATTAKMLQQRKANRRNHEGDAEELLAQARPPPALLRCFMDDLITSGGCGRGGGGGGAPDPTLLLLLSRSQSGS
ncbi:hypothetical protein GW17_00036765, partial [Ensete ventricosum]